MSWTATDHFSIYKQTGMYSAHPCITRSAAGDLSTFFHRSPDHGYSRHSHPLFDIRVCRSSDGGATWSDPAFVASDPMGGILDFGAHRLSDGCLFIHASSVELLPDRSHNHGAWSSRPGMPFFIRSEDEGQTWSEPVRFPMLPDSTWGAPATHSGVCRSSLIETSAGRLLLPAKATDDPEGQMPYFGMIRVSEDQGRSWEYGGRIAKDPVAHFSEPAAHVTPSGRIIMLYRCHPVPKSGAEDVHLALVESDDGGASWSLWRPTTLMGSPGHMLGLRDGRILVTVGTRWEGQRGCTGRVLDPEASDIEVAPDFVIRSDSHDPDCGYPWAVETDDGKILVTYYFTHPDGTRGIEGSIIEEITS
jgi:sialidase-1